VDTKELKLNIDTANAAIKLLEPIIKRAEKWRFGQRLVAAAVLIFSAISLIFGFSQPHIVLAIVLLLFGVSFLTRERKWLVAEHVVVKDDSGAYRAIMTAHEGVPQFSAFDNSGSVRANMAVKEDGTPILTLFDPDTKPRIYLLAHPEAGPGLSLQDIKNQDRLVLNLRENLSGRFTLCNEEGTPLLMAEEAGEKAYIVGRDETSEITWTVPKD
jgi:hypothetical protein